VRSRRITYARNRLDLTDRVQVRVVKKRLKVSDEQFASLVQKAGNSIAGLRKEATCQRLLTLPKGQVMPAQVPAAEVPPAEAIASVEELVS
jgi:hypothetical protein